MDNKILHVEDNPDDVLLLQMAFRKAGLGVTFDVANDGEKAMALLQGSNTRPSCVLLDIKLPTVSGLEVLAWLRQQPGLKRLPVIMLTSSLLPEDIARAYDLGANSYLVKPAGLDALQNLARLIDQYWLRTNAAPALG